MAKKQNNKTETKKASLNPNIGIPKMRIKEKSYTESDIIFIANKFIQFGLNIQSIVQVMKEQEVQDAFASNPQMQEVIQKLFKEKEKLIDFKDLQTKLLKIENIEVALKYPDVFQISIIEKLEKPL